MVKDHRIRRQSFEREEVKMFDRIQPGSPWWWWFSFSGRLEVYRVVRDGSGGLWVNDGGEVCKLSEFKGVPIEAVKPARNTNTHEIICQTAQAVPEEGNSIFVVQQERTYRIGKGFIEVWEFVQPFFTPGGAEDYVQENFQDLQSVRIVEINADKNEEWKAIRKLLKLRP